MNARLVEPFDKSYQELLGQLRHDIYHTPEYLLHAAECESARPVVFIAESTVGTVIVPLLFRPLPSMLDAPQEWADARTPYGYAGPLIRCDAEHCKCVMDEFHSLLWETLHAHGIISVFLRWHPLLSPSADVFCPHTTMCGQTVYMDLASSPRELDAQVRKGHRYEIRRLANDGFFVVMNDWNNYTAFSLMYQAAMEDLEAAESYRFPAAYFDRLRALLGDKLHLGCVFSPRGELASASLFMEECGMVQYHLSGTDAAFRDRSPAKLLLQYVRDWSAQRGNRYFHLGGGLGASEDSLFRFKAGFSKSRASYYVTRMIINPERYALLTQRRLGSVTSPTTTNQFFPSYRLAS